MVAMLNGDRIRVFSGNEGVHVGAVTSIQGKGAEIWIGGEFGLEFFDGSRFHAVDPSDGSALGGVSGIVAAPDDGLWFSENQGIRHIPEAQLRQLDSGKVEFETFGVLDGLTADLRGSLSSPSAVQTTDGRIWFATTKGVAWINPKRVVRNAVPPPVFIESVIADGRKYDISTFLKLPPRSANLQICYTATSLTIPERVRFRYLLEGQDKEWQDAGTRREAFYTNLNPGSYHFRVIACNNDGVWNEIGTVLHFDVLPAFYQTITFRLAALVAGVLLLVALYQLRLRQAAAGLSERLEERLAERERIGRDLHDTLLQGFQGLILRFHDAMMEIPEREPARQLMETALDRADEVMAEGRDRVVSLHPSFDKYGDLAQSLARAGVEIANGSEVKISVSAEGHVQTLDPVALDEIYYIGREAIVNAFRHAQGQGIEVEVDYASWEFRLRVRDDGRGIDPKILEAGRPGHIGLASMRERAERVGGRLDIISGPGAGTEIELRVPAAKAYRGILFESVWRRLWHSTLCRF
jgi:signal transduction histidine kinase